MSQEKPEGAFEKFATHLSVKLDESHLPTDAKLGFKSTVGFYGGKLKTDQGNRMFFDMTDVNLFYDMTGLVSRFDQWGDPALRVWDEHISRNVVLLARKRPQYFLNSLPFESLLLQKTKKSKRYRDTKLEITEHAENLGLGDYYDLHPKGIEIKWPATFMEGLALQDIFRADLIGSPVLDPIDRFQALAAATEYVSEVHNQHGGIGEVLPSDIIFQAHQDSTVSDPVLNIPDIIYNPNKRFGEREQRAMDLLDFMFSIAVEEFRRSSGNWDSVREALDLVVGNYEQKKVIAAVNMFAKRGRLVLDGDSVSLGLPDNLSTKLRSVFGKLHNPYRLGVNRDMAAPLRTAIIDASTPNG